MKVWALEESGLNLEVRRLEFEARFLIEPGSSADSETKVLLGFRVVVKVVKGLPREERLKLHSDWWYFQNSYCSRIRKIEDQRLLDPHTPMRKDLKMEGGRHCLPKFESRALRTSRDWKLLSLDRHKK